MTTEQLVPTLEKCKLLKEAGWKQGKSCFRYLVQTAESGHMIGNLRFAEFLPEFANFSIDAPTLQELLEELRANFPNLEFEMTTRKDPNEPFGLTVYNGLTMLRKIKNPNPAEAAALLWLELRKENRQ